MYAAGNADHSIHSLARPRVHLSRAWPILLIASFVFLEIGCSLLPPPAIISQPADQTAYPLQRATFHVGLRGGGPFMHQWQKNGANIPGATEPAYTTPRLSPADTGEQFRVIASNPKVTLTSNPATLTVTAGIDSPTFAYENMRTGQDLNEKRLTTSSVSRSTFAKLGSLMVDGLVDAQPLYLSNVLIPNVGP